MSVHERGSCTNLMCKDMLSRLYEGLRITKQMLVSRLCATSGMYTVLVTLPDPPNNLFNQSAPFDIYLE